MIVYVADAHAHVQRLDSVTKMATVLEECTKEEQLLFCVVFLWTKGLTANEIHKKMFLVYGGKCLSRKAAQNWVNVSLMTKRLKRRCEMAETTVKRLLCCGFRRTGKAMGQV
jgi:hypothetical protein